MYIKRYLEEEILKKIEPNKAVIIYGPRQTGKTTLLNSLKSRIKGKKILAVNGEDLDIQQFLSSQSSSRLKEFLGNAKILIIDEAQKIPDIGLNIKIIVDQLSGVSVIATGSSSFELMGQIGEPLVGRKWQFYLFPLAQLELSLLEDRLKTAQLLNQRLIYGGYPRVIVTNDLNDKRLILEDILDNYLFKDLLTVQGVKKAGKMINLLRLIAFQIGKEVSLSELASGLELNLATVEKYLDLLEKVFIIKKVGGFSRNLRKEVNKTSRYYFLDNGVRNIVINNLNPLETRNDVGELWENYLFSERMKKQQYCQIHANNYFWRTYDQKEIDLVEEREGFLYGFEFKWGLKKVKTPKDWLNTYKNAKFEIINKDNYLNFIT